MRSNFSPLAAAFYLPPPDLVAPALIGKILVRRRAGGLVRTRIVETEAYLGAGDAAAHTAAGLTARTAILFGPPGRAYVYLVYGLHYCLNVSTLPDGQPGGVLFRALEPLESGDGKLTGPGRLCRALDIDLRLNGCNLTTSGPLFLTEGAPPERVAVGARIGIRQARELPYRFFDPDSTAVSTPRGPILGYVRPR